MLEDSLQCDCNESNQVDIFSLHPAAAFCLTIQQEQNNQGNSKSGEFWAISPSGQQEARILRVRWLSFGPNKIAPSQPTTHRNTAQHTSYCEGLCQSVCTVALFTQVLAWVPAMFLNLIVECGGWWIITLVTRHYWCPSYDYEPH